MGATLRAKSSFSYDHRGTPVSVRAGELRPSGHPDVKGREGLFEPAETAADRQSVRGSHTVERATAAPGERRTLSSK